MKGDKRIGSIRTDQYGKVCPLWVHEQDIFVPSATGQSQKKVFVVKFCAPLNGIGPMITKLHKADLWFEFSIHDFRDEMGLRVSASANMMVEIPSFKDWMATFRAKCPLPLEIDEAKVREVCNENVVNML